MRNVKASAAWLLFEQFAPLVNGDAQAAALLTLAQSNFETRQAAALAAPVATEMLTIKQAAERLNIGERTVRRLCEDGKLRSKRIGSGRGTIRIATGDLARVEGQAAATRIGQATLKQLAQL
jgi:excisionase family DNA binding protein